MKKGFSKIILLLFVVALVAGGVFLYNRSKNQSSAKEGNNKKEFSKAATTAKTCLRKGGIVGVPSVGKKICNTGNEIWPQLSDEWEYGQSNVVSASTFSATIQKGSESFRCDGIRCINK